MYTVRLVHNDGFAGMFHNEHHALERIKVLKLRGIMAYLDINIATKAA